MRNKETNKSEQTEMANTLHPSEGDKRANQIQGGNGINRKGGAGMERFWRLYRDLWVVLGGIAGVLVLWATVRVVIEQQESEPYKERPVIGKIGGWWINEVKLLASCKNADSVRPNSSQWERLVSCEFDRGDTEEKGTPVNSQIVDAIKEGGHRMGNIILANSDFSNRSLENAELSMGIFSKAHFNGADLLRSALRVAHLEGAYLNGANLEGADLSGAYLYDADLTGGTNLENSTLTEANLEGASLIGADLSCAILNRANIKHAILLNANLRRAKLISADLTNADLSNVNLSNANLTNAKLAGANLSDANLTGAIGLKKSDFKCHGDGGVMTLCRTIMPNGTSVYCDCELYEPNEPDSMFVGTKGQERGFMTKVEPAQCQLP